MRQKQDAFENPGRFSSGHFLEENSGRAASMLPGYHSMEFDASDLASGVYVYQLALGRERVSRKMVLLK